MTKEHLRTIAFGAGLLALTAASFLANAAQAQEFWRRDDIRRFHERDERIWHQGRWFHGRHDGRLGWWWIVGGSWYFYPAPTYPIPAPLIPPVVAPAPPSPVPVPPPGPNYWYYCPNPPGYYPYVPSCPTEWTLVPASPG